MSSNQNLVYVYSSVPFFADSDLSTPPCTSSSTSNHVAIPIDDEKFVGGSPNSETLLLAQDYEIPKIVTQRLNADVAQANAAAVISAFFAGALITLASMIQSSSDGSERLPQALRWFSYSSVFLALASTFLCLACVRMTSDLPGMAAQKILAEPNGLVARVARGEPIPIQLLRNPHEMLRQFGGSKSYQAIDNAFNAIFMFGCFCTFVSLIIWIWLVEEYQIAGAIMATVVPVVICVIWSFRPDAGFRSRIRRSFR